MVGAAPCREPWSARVIVWLLRATGHSSGRGLLPTAYALLLYAPLTYASLALALKDLQSGLRELNTTGAFFTTAFDTSFFGVMDVVTWLPITCTFLFGRRHYPALLAEARRTFDAVDVRRRATTCANMRRFTHRLLAFTVAVAGFVLVNHLLHLGIRRQCQEGADACAGAVFYALLQMLLDICVFFIPVKLSLAVALISCGATALNDEVRALVEEGSVCRRRLTLLRRRHDALSTASRRLMDGMRMELVSSMFYGILSKIYTYLLLVLTVRSQQAHHHLTSFVLSMYRATFSLTMPCESAQRLLDRSAQLRDDLLRLHSDDVATNQELLLLLEATRRDLDGIGDLAFYRLQRPTMVAISSTIVTYIIVLMQFLLTEDGAAATPTPATVTVGQ
ncbi:hypothetical protein FJT64_027295 [Amphibalanus amphitrite]|uniref:Gustatory receptor n=1 Tax=Amphibalanus amphitrite TaxID=1232801 RepID=A0A6A4W8Q6_AMPAM|nr:hypothetical protein FJT64_027295 [Amphibalanus amphitrite]